MRIDSERTRIAASILMEKRSAAAREKRALALAAEAAREKSRAAAREKRALALVAEAARDDIELALYNSGLETLCYHFGYCSDVVGDVWLEMYDAYGLEGLKEHLRNTSDCYHKGEKCNLCCEEIKNLHD